MHTYQHGSVVSISTEEVPPPWLALNGAFALIFSKGTRCIPRILTVKRKENGLIELPGGGIEAGESSINALRRELGEETALFPEGEFLHAGKFEQKVPLRDENGKIIRDGTTKKPVKLFTGSVDLWLYSKLVNVVAMLHKALPCAKEVESVHFMDGFGIAQLGLQKGVMLGHLRMIAAFMAKHEVRIGNREDWAERCCRTFLQGALRSPVVWGGRTY